MPNIEKTFDLVCEAAKRGERCPQNYPHGPVRSKELSELARNGCIRIEVFSKNWRVITILTGEFKGLHTQLAPFLPAGAKPYVVIDARSPMRRYSIPLAQRREPWKPGTPRQ